MLKGLEQQLNLSWTDVTARHALDIESRTEL